MWGADLRHFIGGAFASEAPFRSNGLQLNGIIIYLPDICLFLNASDMSISL